MASLNYQADPQMTSSYELLPKGEYLAMIIASELKSNKARTGEYLQLTFEVIDGSGKGRKVFDRLNIRNANKVAEKIAMEQLNALCLAANVLHLQDSEQLHNIPLKIVVDIESGKDGYDDQNRIKGYKRAGGSPAHGQAMAAVAQERAPAEAAPAASGGSTPVWKKRQAA
jgi:hypothetical protein